MDIYHLISHPLKVATMCELQTVYNTEDAYDLLEYLELYDEFEYIRALERDRNK